LAREESNNISVAYLNATRQVSFHLDGSPSKLCRLKLIVRYWNEYLHTFRYVINIYKGTSQNVSLYSNFYEILFIYRGGRQIDKFRNFQLFKNDFKEWNYPSYIKRLLDFLDIPQKLFKISKNVLYKNFMFKTPPYLTTLIKFIKDNFRKNLWK